MELVLRLLVQAVVAQVCLVLLILVHLVLAAVLVLVLVLVVVVVHLQVHHHLRPPLHRQFSTDVDVMNLAYLEDLLVRCYP